MSAQVRNPLESDGPPFATIFRGTERCLVSGEGITIDSWDGREEGSFVGISRIFCAWQFLTTFCLFVMTVNFHFVVKRIPRFFFETQIILVDSIFVEKSFSPCILFGEDSPFWLIFFSNWLVRDDPHHPPPHCWPVTFESSIWTFVAGCISCVLEWFLAS